jgi:hypothetical protein
MNKFIGDLISEIKTEQLDMAVSLANGNAINWESYQRMVGMNMGLQKVLDLIEQKLEEEEK